MKALRKIIEIDEELCDGCGQCVPDCAEGSLKIIDGKAKLVADKLCDGLGACLGSCPTGALKIVEREADEFDEEAVEEYLASEKKKAVSTGCPSAQLQTFTPASEKTEDGCKTANIPSFIPGGETDSELTHWPVQIRLVPTGAPFLQNSNLLVAADCSAVAVKNFQENYLKGKTVMMGCPKFDDAASYVEKFAEIIATSNLQSLTILIMEVPCCSAMKTIVKKAMEKAGTTVPVEEVTISTRGQEIGRTRW